MTLGATDDQADFPVIYSSARDGYAFLELSEQTNAAQDGSMEPLFQFIMEHVHPAPDNSEKAFRMQVTTL